MENTEIAKMSLDELNEKYRKCKFCLNDNQTKTTRIAERLREIDQEINKLTKEKGTLDNELTDINRNTKEIKSDIRKCEEIFKGQDTQPKDDDEGDDKKEKPQTTTATTTEPAKKTVRKKCVKKEETKEETKEEPKKDIKKDIKKETEEDAKVEPKKEVRRKPKEDTKE